MSKILAFIMGIGLGSTLGFFLLMILNTWGIGVLILAIVGLSYYLTNLLNAKKEEEDGVH